MPTAAELTILIQAQDRASAQLQQVGAQVQRLERQVQGVSRGGGILGGLGLGAGFQAVNTALGGIGGIFRFITDSVFDLNSQLERTVTTFEQVTGSAAGARDVVIALRAEAARSPFTEQETFRAGTALISVAQRSTASVLELVRAAEVLATMDPAQGLEGAAFGLREALGGNLESLAERFELSTTSIRRFIAQGLTPLQAILAELRLRGFGEESIERFGRTLEGRLSTIQSFGNEIRQRLGAGVFASVSDLLGRAVRLIEVYGNRVREWAEQVGAAIGGLLERLAAQFLEPVLALLDRLAPGFREVFQAVTSQASPAVEQLEQAGQATETLEHRLGRLGVASAELQLEANRVRRSYDDQLEPLQRQLRLLQQSADLQRVQNALATNRATVENLRLDREITALQRAAQGQEDPSAPGLTVRQRAIALALQERRLRQEELGLTEQQRPAIQSVEQQIAALQEQQRRALEPLERSLALRKEEIDWLQIQRDKTKLAADEMAAGANQVNDAWKNLKNDPAALENARQRGQELADEWLKGYRDWVEEHGTTVWSVLWTTFKKWYDGGGREQLVQVSTTIGEAIGNAVADALDTTLARRVHQVFEDRTGVTATRQALEDAARIAQGLPPGGGGSAGGGSGFGGGGGVTINAGDVQVNGVTDQALTERFRTAFVDFVQTFIASQSITGPGANVTLQGAGR